MARPAQHRIELTEDESAELVRGARVEKLLPFQPASQCHTSGGDQLLEPFTEEDDALRGRRGHASIRGIDRCYRGLSVASHPLAVGLVAYG